jgi:hypothetical protein
VVEAVVGAELPKGIVALDGRSRAIVATVGARVSFHTKVAVLRMARRFRRCGWDAALRGAVGPSASPAKACGCARHRVNR